MSQTKIGVGMINATSIGDAKLLQGDGSWVTPASADNGNWVFLETQTFSGSTLTFQEGSVSAGYDYMFTWRSIKQSSDGDIFIRIGTGGGPTYLTSGYLNGRIKWAGGGHYGQAGSTVAFDVNTSGGGTAALECKWGNCVFHDPAVGIATECTYQSVYEDSGGAVGVNQGGGFQSGTAAITGFQVYASAGTLDSGPMYVFRRKLS